MMNYFERQLFTGEWPQSLLDVGAQVGEFSRQFVRHFPNCQPTLVEANPHCAGHLQATGYPFHIFAASNRQGRAEFFVSKENLTSTGNSLYRERTPHFDDHKAGVIEVELKTLDSVFPSESFDLIKVDVQGAELEVLQGATRLLSKAKTVLLELSLAEYNQGAPLADVVIDEMKKHGYRIQDIFEYHRIPEVFDGGIFQIDLLFVKDKSVQSQRGFLTHEGMREPVLNYLKEMRRLNPDFKVIDIGASANPWSAEVVDAIFDREKSDSTKLQFVGDLNSESAWLPLLNYVAQNGRFDYAICSHTLEDLAYPQVTLRNLGMIAEAGFISVPSVQTEMSQAESGPWRGYIHHRWLIDYDMQVNQMVFYPKLPFLEYMDIPKKPLGTEKSELQVYWRGRPSYRVANEGFMGPSVNAVIDLFSHQLFGQGKNG